MSLFENVKKNFGLGCMRLPMKGDEVDCGEFCRMVDYFMESAFNYFDTARVYLGTKSESAIRNCIVRRYRRESFILTDKLSTSLFNSEEEIRPLFELQLESCGVDYFDFYLMHAQSKNIFEKYKKCRAYEQAMEFKKEGRIKHLGISFHDKAEVLDEILCEYPEVEVVQIQLNYADFDDPAVQSRLCYEVCRKHGKPVIVMEPVKGGNLADLPPKAKTVLEDLHGGSAASYALRFAAGFEGIIMVLSGMSNMEQMEDNVAAMKDFHPLSADERAAPARRIAASTARRLNRADPSAHPQHPVRAPAAPRPLPRNTPSAHPQRPIDRSGHTFPPADPPTRRISPRRKAVRRETACPTH